MTQDARCPECKKTAKRTPSLAEQRDGKGRLYQLPCYFCVECHHEELVPLDEIKEWARAYWIVLPQSIRPPVASTRRKGSPDYG